MLNVVTLLVVILYTFLEISDVVTHTTRLLNASFLTWKCK